MVERTRVVTIREDPLDRLAQLVTQARQAMRDERGKAMSKPKAAQAAGLSRQTLDNVEAGVRASDLTYAQLEQFLGWVPGSILRYVKDNGPEPGPAPEVTVEQQATDTGQSLTARFGELSAEEQALVDAMIETLRRRH